MQRYNRHQTVTDLPRSGRPKLLEKRDINRLKFAIREYPKIHYVDLPRESGLADLPRPPSESTMYRSLRRLDLIKYRTSRRPQLLDQNAKLRRKFVRRWRNFNFGYRTIKFSDETSVHRNVGGDREWCFRYPHERFKWEMVTEVPKSNGISIMVWGAIWVDRRGNPHRSPLVIMKRDLNSKKDGYAQHSYIETLRKGLLPD